MLFGDDDEEFMDDDSNSGYVLPEDVGLPLPRFATSVIGHDDVEKNLLDAINAGKIPHAMIFSGLQGIGKSTMALRLAKFLLTWKIDTGPSLFGDSEPAIATSLDSNPEDSGVKLIQSGGHPDMRMIEKLFDEKTSRFKESLSIEQIREIPEFMQKTPFLGGWRIVIVDDADTMTRQAQNGLLKILEEPPQNAILILITHRPGQMLPTIRSRCRLFEFSVPSRADFDRLLENQVSNLEALYNISGGSIGTALRLMETGALKSLEQITTLLAPWPNLNKVDIHLMAEVLGGKGNDTDSLIGFQDTLIWVCEQIAKARARGLSKLPVPLSGQPYLTMLADYTLEDWSKICDNLRTHFDMVKYGSLDKRHAIMGAFSILKDK